ncbi:hypothetical protein EZV62_005833 [Acer yangbiense]|uniref:BED-type domain-containing protein n=1 Tax=Acer yangbiense TaxID=1000413 RepID=A0A5C7IP55_9ROSI|nr:hypothetical protein EZV62_005833 [Acer yangbiense]
MTSFERSEVNVSTGSGNNEIEDVEPNSASCGFKQKRKTSIAWNYLTKVDVIGVRMAKCHFCEKLLNASLGVRASSLNRHVLKCLNDHQDDYNTSFDQNVGKSLVAKMIITHELPLGFTEYTGFREMIKYYQPRFKSMSKNTLKNDIFKLYNMERDKTLKLLESIESKVAVTTDMWTSSTKMGYMVQYEPQYKCLLDESDWQFATIMVDHLKPFYKLTELFLANLVSSMICKMRETMNRWLNSRHIEIQAIAREFDVDMEADEFLDWVDNIEGYFDWKEVSEERKVKLVGANLRGPTFTWWKHYQNDQEVKGKAKLALKIKAQLNRGSSKKFGTEHSSGETSKANNSTRGGRIEAATRPIANSGGIDTRVNLVENDNDEEKGIEGEESQYEGDKGTDDEEERIEGNAIGDVLVKRRTMLPPPVIEKDNLLQNLKEIQENVRQRLIEMNQLYKEEKDQNRRFKEYQVGDFVIMFFRKKRFPTADLYTFHGELSVEANEVERDIAKQIPTNEAEVIEAIIQVQEMNTRASSYVRFLVKWMGRSNCENS